MKQEFLDKINQLRNNNYNNIESYKILNKLYLMLIENHEEDEDIWTVYSQLIKDIDDKESSKCEKTFRRLCQVNQEDFNEVCTAENKYLSLPLEIKKTISYRVMCPKSENNNFNAFF